MGRPKQLLNWKESNLLEHAIQTAKSLPVKNIVVVLGAFSDMIQAQTNLDNVSVYYNNDWERGLGNSIASGVSQYLDEHPETDAIMVMLSDQPMIESDYLKKLMDEFEATNALIVASQYGEEKFGVPAIFNKELFADLTSLDSGKGAKALISKHLREVHSIDEKPNLVDIDTVEQYESLYRINHQ